MTEAPDAAGPVPLGESRKCGTEPFADLLARAAAGDRSAVDSIVRQYDPQVRLVARVLLGPALRPYLDTLDLTQSVHESVLVGLRDQKFDIAGPEQLVSLAVTVLRRKVAKHWRHLQRQQRLSGAGGRSGDSRADVLTGLSSPGTDPVAHAQFREQVGRLCEYLDDTERRVLDLRLEGHTVAEIADLIGVGRVALRVRLTRLRQRLQAAGVVTDWL